MNSNGVAPDRKQGPSATTAPQVRHIPIFVEGRDEPIINRTEENAPNPTHPPQQQQPPPQKQIPQPQRPATATGTSPSSSSIFNRVKDFPVRSGDFFQSHLGAARGSSPFGQRTSSPARTIPVPVQHETPPPQPPQNAADSSIEKIQAIQRDVLALMDQVEQFQGTSKRDKQYLYLDEMLTQNLLKLDTIDTEGKENIKQARREAIKCINICIAALEQKAEAAAAAASGQ